MVRFRPVLGVALVSVLGAGLLTACSSDPTPSGVSIGWADKTRKAIRVSWQDSNQPNRITIEGVVSASPAYVKYLGAADPNTWAIPTSAFPPDGNYKIAVAVGTSVGGVTSKSAVSPMFDTDGPVRPTDATARASGKDVVVTWNVPPATQDFSPGDPLDVPVGSQVYVPVVGRAGQPFKPVSSGTTSTRQVVKNLKPPYLFQLRARNEWASLTGGEISGRTTSTSAAVPTIWTFGKQMLIRGRTVQQEISCAESRCVAQQTTSAGLPVVLLAQSRAGGPWVQAGRSTTQPGGHFELRVITTGTRAYRVYVPTNSRTGALSSASSSTSSLTRSRVMLQSAAYTGGNVRNRNEVVTATIVVRPAVARPAIFQYWNGRAWGNVKEAPFSNGRASVSFRAVRPGVFAYRFLIPGTTYQGNSVYGIATPSLVLRIR